MNFLTFQIEHYTQRLAEVATFVVTPQGIEYNPAKRYLKQRLHQLKKQLHP